jgi:hypothetical protein
LLVLWDVVQINFESWAIFVLFFLSQETWKLNLLLFLWLHSIFEVKLVFNNLLFVLFNLRFA